MVAIIPAAGKGTRMAPVTGGSPKELLKLGSKPVLLRIMEEARQAEPDEIVVISSPDKEEVDSAVRSWARDYFRDVPVRIAYQTETTGAAPAIAAAEEEDDALILFGDCVYAPESPVGRLSNLVSRGIDGLISVEQISDDLVHQYGICEVEEGTGGVRRILEKPNPEETASRWAIAARFALSKGMMIFLNDYCEQLASPGRPEIPLPEVLNAAIRQGIDIRAVPLQEYQTRVDCGSPAEYKSAVRLKWD